MKYNKILQLLVLTSCQIFLNAKQEGFFWQLTDLHYDPWYYLTQESCNENLTVLGKYGDFECDAPWELVKSSILAMESLPEGREADFILWSGDNPPHAKDPNIITKEIIMEITKNITDIIKEIFPDKLVIPVLGNHDFYPKNQLPGDGSDMYDQYADMWESWLNGSEVQQTFKKGAYFTLMLSESPAVRAVILNTNLYLTANSATEGQDDPGGQLAWFDSVMNNARQKGEKVHIFTHVPTGYLEVEHPVRWMRKQQNSALHSRIVEFGDIILGYYGAHTHFDAFKLFYNQQGSPVASLLIPPSVSPWRARFGDGLRGAAHNPGLRKYTFTKSTYELLDVEQYYLNLERANSDLQANWRLLYSFANAYHLSNISTPQLHNLLEEMKTYASNQFHRYYDYNTVYTSHSSNEPCNCYCKTSHLCAIEFVDYDQFDQCFQEEAACSANKLQQIGIVMLALFLFNKMLL